MQILSKSQQFFFNYNYKAELNINKEMDGTKNSQSNLEDKNKVKEV